MLMEVVIIICTILGGFAALWYFWEKFTSKKPDGEELEPDAASKSPEDCLKIVLKGAEAVAAWRKKFPDESLVLRGENLRRADLVKMDLSGADLREVNLQWGDIRWADLIGADLSGANLERADFHKADLGGVNFHRTNLSNVNFEDANLSGANFGEALFAHTIFRNTDLANSKGLSKSHHRGPSTIDLETLKKSGILPPEFLRGCGLSDAAIKEAHSSNIEALSVSLYRDSEFYSCFISYVSKNENFAEKLYNDLQKNGIRCWFAQNDMKIGDKILDSIFDAIQEHEKILIILSEYSIASDWVKDEISKAFDFENKRKQTIVFPIRIDDSVMTSTEPWVDKIRNNRHIGNFKNWQDPPIYKQAFDRLMRDLKKPSIIHGDMDEKNTVETRIKLPIRLRQNYDDLESMLKSNGVQLIRFPDRKVTANFNGHTISYHRPKRAKKPVKESFLKEIENFLKRGGEII